MPDTELELAPVQPDEAPMKQLQPFDAMRAELEKLKATAETLTVTSIDDKAGMKLARATRLSFKELRVSIEKKRKELGEEALRTTQKINADAKQLKDLIEPLETRMLKCEEFAEREKVRIEDEKRSARSFEILPFLTGAIAVDLGKMSDADYSSLLADATGAHAARLAAAAKAESDRIAAEKAEQEERERIRLENERLRKEAEEREAAAAREREEAAAKLKAEQDRAEAELKAEREAARKREAELAEAARKEREIAEMKAKAERERVEAEQRSEREKAQKERDVIEAKAREQKELDERIKADLQKRVDDEKRAREEQIAKVTKQIEDEATAKAEKEEAEKSAPDKDKLLALSKAIRGLVSGIEMKSKKGIAAFSEAKRKLEAICVDLEIETSVRGKTGELL